MFALGCSLYEILTLRSVYDDEQADVFPVPVPQVFLEVLSMHLFICSRRTIAQNLASS